MESSPGPYGGPLLQRLSASQGVDKAHLAEALGCDESTIRFYFNGTRRIPLELVKRIAEILQLAVDEKSHFMDAVQKDHEAYKRDKEQRKAAELLIGLPKLPQPSIHFIGHTTEIDTLMKRVSSVGRIVNIKGAPGIGKTTVALVTANRVWDTKRAVLWWDAREQAGGTVRQLENHLWTHLVESERSNNQRLTRKRLAEAIERFKPLLVLDNLDAASEFSKILEFLQQVCRSATVLVTSRRRLPARVAENYELGELSPDEAIHLFRRVAGLDDPPRAASPAVDELVRTICCVRLGMHPGAIDIAASLCASCPLQVIDEGLRKQAMKTLVDPSRPDFNRSMYLSISLSYDVLGEADETRQAWTVFPRLAVFPASFGYEAAAAVADTPDVSQTLTLLVDRSLVRFDGQRYLLHAVVRLFGRDKLGPHKEELELTAAQYYAHLVQSHNRDFQTIGEEQANIQFSLDWLASHTAHKEIFHSLVNDLYEYAHASSLNGWYLQLLQWGLKLAQTRVDQTNIFNSLHALSCFFEQLGDHANTIAYAERAFEVAQASSEPTVLGAAAVQLASAMVLQGKGDAARTLLHQAYPLLNLGALDHRRYATILAVLSDYELMVGDTERAYSHLETVLSLARQIEDNVIIAKALDALCRLDLRQQQLDRASDRCKEFEIVAQATADPELIGRSLFVYASIASEQGNWQDCKVYSERAAAVFEEAHLELYEIQARLAHVHASFSLLHLAIMKDPSTKHISQHASMKDLSGQDVSMKNQPLYVSKMNDALMDDLSLYECTRKEQWSRIDAILTTVTGERAASAYAEVGRWLEESEDLLAAKAYYEQALKWYHNCGAENTPPAQDIAKRLSMIDKQ